MATNTIESDLITVSFTLPSAYKERLEKLAQYEDRSASAVMRRILADHFARLDANIVNTPAGNGRAAAEKAATK